MTLLCTSTKPCGADEKPHAAIIRLAWGQYGGADCCIVAGRRLTNLLDATREKYDYEPITSETEPVAHWSKVTP